MSVSPAERQLFTSKPGAVLFDIDNTLYAYSPAHEKGMQAVLKKAKATLGIEEKNFLGAFEEARALLQMRLQGTAASHNRLLYMQLTLERLGLKSQLFIALDLEQTYWLTYLAAAVLFEGAKDFILALKRAGIATAVVTDLTAQIQFRKLIYFGLNECFDFIVTSEEAGVEKPAQAPFDLALAKLGCDADEVLMIGDNGNTDIVGAKRLGIACLQKRHAGVEIYKDERAPHLIFDTFSELELFLAKQGWLEMATIGHKS